MQPFQRSELTNALVRYLQMHDKGSRVSYSELTQATGSSITTRTPHLIVARRILARDHAQVWCCIAPAIGIWRLNDAEIAERQRTWYLQGARNRLTASAHEADLVELAELDIRQQARFATDSIIREIARDALARTTQKRIEKVARGTSNDLPAFNAVEWMISLSPKRGRKADTENAA